MLSNLIFLVRRKWLINYRIEQDSSEKSLNEAAEEHRIALGSPNWLVKWCEPSLNLSIRTRQYHYSSPARVDSPPEGFETKRKVRIDAHRWMRDTMRTGVTTLLDQLLYIAVSRWNSKLTSFCRRGTSYLR